MSKVKIASKDENIKRLKRHGKRTVNTIKTTYQTLKYSDE
jgi:hypothetical protein